MIEFMSHASVKLQIGLAATVSCTELPADQVLPSGPRQPQNARGA